MRLLTLIILPHCHLCFPLPIAAWNFVNCGVTAQILKDTAQAMHDRGLLAAGYEYVNSDDVGEISHLMSFLFYSHFSYPFHLPSLSPPIHHPVLDAS